MNIKKIIMTLATLSSFFSFSKAMACKEGAVNHSKRNLRDQKSRLRIK